jgi:peptidoglycan/xylan/chitin deacetylase (PgdA/CDA1 family)
LAVAEQGPAVGRLTRRAVLGGTLLGAAGVAGGAAGGPVVRHWFGWDRPPVFGGYAAAADNLDVATHAGVTVRYHVQTTEPVVAFTFDDGPAPHWTPMVLDELDRAQVPATFFMVGRNVTRHSDLVRGRLARHDVGNHSWKHDDLATMDLGQVTDDLERSQAAIRQYTGRSVTLFRPPYGHLGGSTVLAANQLGYDLTLWSMEMHETTYHDDPAGQAGQAKFIVETARPGSIILAHDAGGDQRLVTIHGLAAMFQGLRQRGFRMVTLSELLSYGPVAEQPKPSASAVSVRPSPLH